MCPACSSDDEGDLETRKRTTKQRSSNAGLRAKSILDSEIIDVDSPEPISAKPFNADGKPGVLDWTRICQLSDARCQDAYCDPNRLLTTNMRMYVLSMCSSTPVAAGPSARTQHVGDWRLQRGLESDGQTPRFKTPHSGSYELPCLNDLVSSGSE